MSLRPKTPTATEMRFRRTIGQLQQLVADLAAERGGSSSFWVLERQGKDGPEYWDGGHAEQYGDIHHAAKFWDKQSCWWIVRPLVHVRYAGVDGQPPRLVEHSFVAAGRAALAKAETPDDR